ncbi:TetR family transcriptional regulator [Pontiellaceae bacterium B12227]|nr:TetR family transcriptional regulator [Pontiellaceae bacterium B12227]
MSTYAAADTTKQKLIQAAGALAAEVGLDNVSTRAVAEMSGENIGSIHYHFGGKDGLFEAVAQDAITGCAEKDFHAVIDELNETSTPADYAKAIRSIIAGEIEGLFCSDRPAWHSHVIYQLLQRDDVLYDLFRKNVLEPNMGQMCRLFQLIDPRLSEEEAFLHTTVMKMPIFAHANYSKAMQERLGVDAYSREYLQKLEDLLVKQALLVLGLPED